jgi:AP endonuclease-1
MNLAQTEPTRANQAYTAFLDDLQRCEKLGIQLYNFQFVGLFLAGYLSFRYSSQSSILSPPQKKHKYCFQDLTAHTFSHVSPGATYQGTLDSSLAQLAKVLISALKATQTVIPVLETMCGQGTTIGGSLSDFRTLFSLIPATYHARLGICIDTCHVFAAGYDLRTPTAFQAFMADFDEQVGLQYLKAVHLNDSRTPLGSRRDLHANIGTGFLGLRAFHNLMNEKRFEGVPLILETPIDRPVEAVRTLNHEEEDEENSEDEDEDATRLKKKNKNKKPKPKKQRKKLDTSIWAREIKLLESLIGMDPESDEFLALEAELAEQGAEDRKKQQGTFDRKKEKQAKATSRKKGKGKYETSEDEEEDLSE